MPRPDRRSAQKAKEKITIAVKHMERETRKATRERNKIKNKKRSASGKGSRPPKQHKGGKTGFSGVRDEAFSGPGRHLNSEPGAVAVANGDCAASNVDGRVLEGLVNEENMQKSRALLKVEVQRVAEANNNAAKRIALFLEMVHFEKAKGGTKMDGGGRLLGRKEDYADFACKEAGDCNGKGEHLDWERCVATYPVSVSSKAKGENKETFEMLPKIHVMAMVTMLFRDGKYHLLSHEEFPSMTGLFWSLGYHFVHCIGDDEDGPQSLAEVFRTIVGEENWDSVDELSDQRTAKTKHPHYRAN